MRNYKKIIIPFLSFVLLFGSFQFVYGIVKSIGEKFTVTVNCSDSNGNLSLCQVISPCSKSCSASGYYGSCTCQFTCTASDAGYSIDACGRATDEEGLTGTKCESGVIACDYIPIANAGPDKEVLEGQTVVLEGSGSMNCSVYQCAESDGQGGCRPRAAGENGLPACQRCDGVSLVPVKMNNVLDTEGTNTCTGKCKKCGSGNCVYQTSVEDLFNDCPNQQCYSGYCNGSGGCGYQTSSQDAYGYCSATDCGTGNCAGGGNACGYYTSGDGHCGTCQTCVGASSASCRYYANGTRDTTSPGTCSQTHYRCNGSGSCTAPCSTATVCTGTGGGYSCSAACTTIYGYCGCMSSYADPGCGGMSWDCYRQADVDSCKCYRWMYD
jgi:hypothetical protein